MSSGAIFHTKKKKMGCVLNIKLRSQHTVEVATGDPLSSIVSFAGPPDPIP